MIDLNNHFLDTNIFLSVVFSDNTKHICDDYFKLEATRFTSTSVQKESKEVISKMEDLSFEIIKSIDDYVSINNVPDEKINNSLNVIKYEFLDKYDLEESPF